MTASNLVDRRDFGLNLAQFFYCLTHFCLLRILADN